MIDISDEAFLKELELLYDKVDKVKITGRTKPIQEVLNEHVRSWMSNARTISYSLSQNKEFFQEKMFGLSDYDMCKQIDMIRVMSKSPEMNKDFVFCNINRRQKPVIGLTKENLEAVCSYFNSFDIRALKKIVQNYDYCVEEMRKNMRNIQVFR